MSEMQIYGNNCNSYVVAAALPGNKHILVDPGMVTNEAGQECLQRLISEMKSEGLNIEDTGLILNTHAHPDHYGASETIREMSGSMVAIGSGDRSIIEPDGNKMAETIRRMGFKMPEIHPDFYLGEGELKLGEDLTARIIEIPGHSNGHIGIYWPATKIFMCGDLIFFGSTGRVDIPGGSAQLLKESIERVAELDIEYLLTGHQYGGPGIISGREEVRKNFDIIRTRIFPYL